VTDLEGSEETAQSVESLKLYTIRQIDAATALQLLQAEFPHLRISTDLGSRMNAFRGGFSPFGGGPFGGQQQSRILVMARPAEHVKVAKFIRDMDQVDEETAPKLVRYQISNGNATEVGRILQSMYQCGVQADFQQNTILVSAPASDQERIRQTIEDLSKPESEETARRFYRMGVETGGQAAVSTILPLLQRRFPQSQFSSGTPAGTIYVLTTPIEEPVIRRAVSQLTDPTEREDFVMKFYPVKSGATGAATIVQLVQGLHPGIFVGVPPTPNRIVVWAKPSDHDRVAKTIESLDSASELTEDEEQSIQTYVFEKVSPGYPITQQTAVLARFFPHLTFTPGYGTQSNTVMVAATAAEHERIASLVKQINAGESAEVALKPVTYTLERMPAGSGMAYLNQMFSRLFPGATFSQGVQTNQIIVMARPEEHTRIAALIEELNREDPSKAMVPAVYSFTRLGTSGIYGPLTILTRLYPSATITTGTGASELVVVTTAAEQEKIAATVAEMNREQPEEIAEKPVTYKLERLGTGMYAYTILASLRQVFPGITFTTGSSSDSFIAIAKPEQHLRIAALVDEMNRPVEETNPKTVKAYTVEQMGAGTYIYSIYTQLATLIPSARFMPGSRTNQFFALADEGDHRKIQDAIDAMNSEDPESVVQTVVYTIDNPPASGIYTIVSSITQAVGSGATITVGGPKQIIAIATAKTQERIAEIVKSINTDDPDVKLVSRTYRLNRL
ncbi:MAG: secretin N-terminal domain-containing protein, partial [Planctomycetia bacterium]|nr:secretin N-terminal domain-containing protein [Planctomycetia bacterium]